MEERKNLQGLQKIFDQLIELKNSMSFEISHSLMSRIRNITSPMLQRTESLQNPHNLDILLPDTNLEFMNVSLSYLGFCLWSLVKRDGLLLPGKPSIGVVTFGNYNCVFCDEKAL